MTQSWDTLPTSSVPLVHHKYFVTCTLYFTAFIHCGIFRGWEFCIIHAVEALEMVSLSQVKLGRKTFRQLSEKKSCLLQAQLPRVLLAKVQRLSGIVVVGSGVGSSVGSSVGASVVSSSHPTWKAPGQRPSSLYYHWVS